MKKFVFGDIHGCYDELISLLDCINPNYGEDKLIFLGDYIDRGPNSYKVVNHLMDLQNQYSKDKIILLRGNHEQMAIDNIINDYVPIMNGYRSTYYDFIGNRSDIKEYLSFLQSLPLYHEDEDAIYVHGGILPGLPMEQQSPDDLLWIRDEFFRSSERFPKTVFFGHTSTDSITGSCTPFIQDDRVGIDTGCVYGGCLSAIEITEDSSFIVHTSLSKAA